MRSRYVTSVDDLEIDGGNERIFAGDEELDRLVGRRYDVPDLRPENETRMNRDDHRPLLFW
jgi:hypothetical protein